MTAKKTTKALAVYKNGKISIPDKRDAVQSTILAFLDAGSTAMGRATFYNKKKSQDDALAEIHEAAMSINRGLYSVMLMLPGITDLSKVQGVQRLLEHGYDWDCGSFLLPDQEREILLGLIASMPITRILRMFEALKKNRVNNRRTRKIIMTTVLGNSSIAYWAVKYRKKIKSALVHALGHKQSSALKGILEKKISGRTNDEKRFVAKSIDKYLADGVTTKAAHEIVCFILGGKKDKWSVDILNSFYAAREEIEKGKDLPTEVLEGIRSKYHKDVPSAQVMELTKETMSEKKKMTSQKSAKKKNVEIAFNPMKQDAVDLYVHAFETGMTSEIKSALKKKAQKTSQLSLMKYDHVGIIVDTSKSMFGTKTQKHRPIAISLAMRDVLRESSNKATIVSSGGAKARYGLTAVKNETSLAGSLVDVLMKEPEAVFIITDGYENSPAGQVAEVIHRVREMGNDTPIYQVSPVMGAETAGIRSLSEDIEPLPISRPEGVGLAMIRSAISQGQLEDGIKGLLSIATKRLEEK